MKTIVKEINTDVTTLEVDAIVNPSNLLYEAGSLSKLIYKKSGPELVDKCRMILESRDNKPIQPGEAILVPGYNIPAKYIIFTSGVYWNGGNANEKKHLYNCYKNSLDLAVRHCLKTIAFPIISSGMDEMPIEIAKEVALGAIRDFIEINQDDLETIYLVEYR